MKEEGGVGEKEEGPWAYRLGSRCVLGRAWALWSQDEGPESQVGMEAGVRAQGWLVLPSVAWDRPSSPWLAEVTLGIEHKVALLRARLGVVEVLRGSGGLVCCPAFWPVQVLVTGVQEARRLGRAVGERVRARRWGF